MFGAHRRWNVALLVPALLLIAIPALAQVPPLGPDFSVFQALDYHKDPIVAIDQNGDFVVIVSHHFEHTWIVAYDRDGGFRAVRPLASVPVYGERPADIVPRHPRGFTAVWQAWEPIGGLEGVHVDRFGNPIGSYFQVCAVSEYASAPRVAVAPSGDMVVVWHDSSSEGGDTSGTSIQARAFAADGTPHGDRFQVNVTTSGDQAYPNVTVGSQHFVVVWESASSAGSDQSWTSIQGRAFVLDGSWGGDEFQVNSHTPSAQERPDIAMGPDSGFVVTWQSQTSAGDDADGTSIQARRFLPSGTPVDPDFQVNTHTPNAQERPAIGMMHSGAFEVVWSDGLHEAPDQWSIERQAFTADVNRAGEQETVNGAFPNVIRHAAPSMSMNQYGNFVTVWDAWDWIIRGRIYRNTLFADGFESGDVSGWW